MRVNKTCTGNKTCIYACMRNFRIKLGIEDLCRTEWKIIRKVLGRRKTNTIWTAKELKSKKKLQNIR